MALLSPLHALQVFCISLPTGFLRLINEFYGREVTNILNLGLSQEHDTVVMTGDKN